MVVPYEAAPASPVPAAVPHLNPLNSASLLSQLLVLWFQPLVSLGAKRPLSSSDLWSVCPSDSCHVLEQRLSTVDKPLPIVFAFLRIFHRPLLIVLATYCFYVAAMALQSSVAQALLDHLHDRENIFQISNGYALVGLMAAVSIVAISCRNYGFFISSRVGANLRSLVMSCVFHKSLRLSGAAKQQYTTGKVLTLMSVDAERVFNAALMGPWLFIAPLGFIVCLALIGLLFDAASAFCGVAVLVLVLILSIYQAKWISVIQRQLLTVVDERVKVTSEALQGVRIIKFYAWEDSIASRVHHLRATEVRLFRKLHLHMVSNSVLLFLTPVFLSGSTLGLYVLRHGVISVTDAFTLVALVNICRAVVNEFTNALIALSQARSSFHRIDTFLASDEFKTPLRLSVGGDLGRISLRKVYTDWSALAKADVQVNSRTAAPLEVLLSNPFALKDLNLDIAPGSLVMIVGTVGSGKSSFLQTLLGEMILKSGELEVNGSISYVSQETWIRNTSVKNNILFESNFNTERYQRVLEASQLSLDLHSLPNGDQTEIGERGINLSGGQKARVAIARAFYRSVYDILILDDPLSAVDPHVAHAIFDEGIAGLAKSKTRLLVLNSHYDLLSRADKVVVFENGQIVSDGTYDEVVTQFPDLRYESKHTKKISSSDVGNELEKTEADSKPIVVMKEEPISSDTVNLVNEEDRVTGTVGRSIYRAYFDETGFNSMLVLFVLVVVYSVGQGMRVLVDWWQGYWASNMTRRGVDPAYSGTEFGMWYLAFIVVCTIVTLGRGFMMTEACIRSAKNLHDELFQRV